MQLLKLTLSHVDPAFSLKIANVSQSSTRIWSETFSLGYNSVSFRLWGQDGNECFIRRKPAIWTVNVPACVAIQPGQNHTLRIDLNDETWVLDPCRIEPRTEIEIAAVLEIFDEENAMAHGITAGLYESNKLKFGSLNQIIN